MPDSFNFDREPIDIANEIIENQRTNIIETHNLLDQAVTANAALMQETKLQKEQILQLTEQVSHLQSKMYDLKLIMNQVYGLLT